MGGIHQNPLKSNFLAPAGLPLLMGTNIQEGSESSVGGASENSSCHMKMITVQRSRSVAVIWTIPFLFV